MPSTIKGKLLLGWMSRNEAVRALNSCIFDRHLGERKAVALWKQYREKVEKLEPRIPAPLATLPLNEVEQHAAENHLTRLNGKFGAQVIKVHPGELILRQFHVVTERSEHYAAEMVDETCRINHCLGIGLNFNGQLVPRRVGANRITVDLPHYEYVVQPNASGFSIKERDRYITAVRTADNRLVLWGGYHRTYALLCQLAGEAAGGAPLLTVMTGIPEADEFFAKPSAVRDAVLGERPALLRDFLDENLFMAVNLRKRRAEARIEMIRPGTMRSGVFFINED
jgi:hypothetical protein